MKGFKTELNNIPSFVYYQSEDGSTIEVEQPIVVEFYRGTVTLIQGKDTIVIDDKYLDDFCETVITNRKKANEYLNR